MTGATSELMTAIDDAERLLRYAASKGIKVDSTIVTPIIGAKTLVGKDDNDPATFADQEKFWDALCRLTAITSPATVDSVKFAQATSAGWIARVKAWITRTPVQLSSMGQRSVRWAGVFALIVLILVSVLQLYADVGSQAIQDYPANKLKWETNNLLLKNQTQPPTEGDAKLRAETAQLLEKTSRQLAALDIWLSKVPFVPASKEQRNTPQHSEELLVHADLILTVLRGFFLPIGWGLLGASLYVCRTLADDISKMSYSAEHRMLHVSRYFMGAVAGYVVAKFSVALSGKSLDDVVQPYVLALLVGYSVDVLFSMFDKLISAFSTR